MKDLRQLQRQLKEILPVEGISKVIKSLRQLIPTDSAKYNLLLQLDSEYRDLRRKTLESILSQEEISLTTNQIRKRVLEFIDGLLAEDFDKQARRSQFSKQQKIRQGQVLYQIPHTMRLGEENRCVVRIAFDKAMLLEDLALDGDTKLKEGMRISDYMKVAVVDPSVEKIFEITTSSEPIQFIDIDDFTEWRFHVKPLQAGEHILELKVSIMLIIDGVARVRERTLEESIVIVAAGGGEPEAPAFKVLEEQLTLPCPISKVTPSSYLPWGDKVSKIFTVGGLMVLIMSTIVWAMIHPEVFNWLSARYWNDNEIAYTTHLEKYPNSRYKETAIFRKALVKTDQDVSLYRAYIASYPEGQYLEQALWAIAQLTNSPEAYLEYATQFPETLKAQKALEKYEQFQAGLRQQAISRKDLPTVARYLAQTPLAIQDTAIINLLEDSLLWQDIPFDTTHPASEDLQQQLWPSLQRLHSVQALQFFIRQFPTGPFAVAAREQLDSLGAKELGLIELNSPNEEEVVQETPEPEASDAAPEFPIPDNYEMASPPLDSDADGIPDKDDHCPTESGTAAMSGCPDTDGDGISDPEDACPQQAGIEALRGCPTPIEEETHSAVKRPKMVLIPGGTYRMGDESVKATILEAPVHTVTVDHFLMGIAEVTFDEYDLFCKSTGRPLPPDEHFGRGKHPVIHVSWYDAIYYCNWLSKQHRYDTVYTINGEEVNADWEANGYRLPTEAEWEFAAGNGDNKETWSGTSDERELPNYGNYYESGNSDKDGFEKTAPVGNYQPNAFGLFDMTGNVAEWCWDRYHPTYYDWSRAERNPKGHPSGTERILRGGSWYSSADFVRCSYRNPNTPKFKNRVTGFRLVKKP